LDSSFLQEYFPDTNIETSMKVRPWKAYPDYSSQQNREKVFPFCVDGNHLYYVNAIEGVASAMEMSCIGARNCVLLAWNKHKSQHHNTDPALVTRRSFL